jgi:hypothetical protein
MNEQSGKDAKGFDSTVYDTLKDINKQEAKKAIDKVHRLKLLASKQESFKYGSSRILSQFND